MAMFLLNLGHLDAQLIFFALCSKNCASSQDRPKLSISFLTPSHQTYLRHPLCLIPSAAIVRQCMTQSASSSHITCPSHHNLLFWYGTVWFNVPLDTVKVILATILRVRWPNQQRHSTEGWWFVNQVNPTRFSSLKGKEKDVSIFLKYIYVYSTVKTKDTETHRRQSAKPSKIKARHSWSTCKNCSYLWVPL